MRRITIAVILFLLCFHCWGQNKKTDYAEMINVIDLWLDAQRDFDKLPGISVAVVHDQNIIFKKGYGYADLEKKIPMKPETIFSICSISKLFTSVAIMQLWEQGKLRLDDSLQALLPDYKINQQYTESVPITVRSMLTHSSGLTRDADSSWNAPNFYFLTKEELKKSLIKEDEPTVRLYTSDKLAMVNRSKFKGKQLVIIKPSTYMNLSGKALNYWMQAEKVKIEDILVITDDLALPFGTLRMKKKGSDGGHNGLNDIANTLNSTEYARIRFGIGNEFSKGKQVDFVLGKWSESEEKTIDERIEKAVEMIKSFVSIGIDRTMSAYNNK